MRWICIQGDIDLVSFQLNKSGHRKIDTAHFSIKVWSTEVRKRSYMACDKEYLLEAKDNNMWGAKCTYLARRIRYPCQAEVVDVLKRFSTFSVKCFDAGPLQDKVLSKGRMLTLN